MPFKVQDLMIDVLAAGGKQPSPKEPGKCGGPSHKAPPCPDPSLTVTQPPKGAAASSQLQLEALRRDLHAFLQAPPAP